MSIFERAAFEAEGDGAVLDLTGQLVVAELRQLAATQRGALIRHYLPRIVPLLRGRPISFSKGMSFFDDKVIPIDPSQGELLYMLSRAGKARCAVEFGTSFGVSTIYLGSAFRDAARGGRVIGTELVPSKIAAARANVAAAGLAEHVELREGDARLTLRTLDRPVDLLLLDGWPSYAMEVLEIVEPNLADGAFVIVDNVGHFRGNLRPVIKRLTADGPYRSCTLPLNSGTLIATFRKY